MISLRRRLAVPVVSAALVLPMMAACSAGEGKSKESPRNSSASDAGESKKQQSIDMRRREENMIAACMKKSGFEYVPFVPPEMLNPPAPKPTDYASLKAFRSKYGFGSYFAPHVYPGDPNLLQPAKDDNPNSVIRDRLDEAQKKAYFTAFDGYTAQKTGPLRFVGGCVAEAVKAVDPDSWKRAKSAFDSLGRNDNGDATALVKTCETDPRCKNKADRERLKPLKAAYEACLKRDGYTVGYDVDEVVPYTVAVRLGRADKDPDVFRTKVDPAVARVELQNEVKVALEDLECGKDYLTAKGEMEARDEKASPPSGGLP